MIRVPDAALSDATAEALQAYQAEIDGESQYEQRGAIAAGRVGIDPHHPRVGKHVLQMLFNTLRTSPQRL